MTDTESEIDFIKNEIEDETEEPNAFEQGTVPWNMSTFNDSSQDGQEMVDYQDLHGMTEINQRLHENDDDDDEEEEEEEEEMASEVMDEEPGSLRLKGALYPGMGGFDAADNDQRRKRNQRKDPAVLYQLQVNSEQVDTVEQVFELVGSELQYIRTRDVFDEPSLYGSDSVSIFPLERVMCSFLTLNRMMMMKTLTRGKSGGPSGLGAPPDSIPRVQMSSYLQLITLVLLVQLLAQASRTLPAISARNMMGMRHK
jgi:hypothetical protein